VFVRRVPPNPENLAFGFGALAVLGATAARREALGDGPGQAVLLLLAAVVAFVAIGFAAIGGWRSVHGLAGGVFGAGVLVYVLRTPYTG
jgi:hypothetical protein